VRKHATTRTQIAHPRKATILAIILISYFMILLDNSVIFTGLPSIRDGLRPSATELSWVQDAYTLVFGGLLLLGARSGDIVGRRRMFVYGLGVSWWRRSLSVLRPLVGGSSVRGPSRAWVRRLWRRRHCPADGQLPGRA